MSLSKIQSVRSTLFKITDSVTLESGVTAPCITGQLSQTGVISQNGYRYKETFWKKVLADPLVQDTIKNRDMLGTIEHPKDDDDFLKTPYSKASHVVLKVWLQGSEPFGTFALLNNEQGNNIKALVDVGHRPGVSTRGLGNFGQDNIGQFVDEDQYCLLGWDIVKSPNFSSLKMDHVTDSLMSSPRFKELTEMYHLRDSTDQNYNRESLLRDIGLLLTEVQGKYELLKKL